MRYYIYAKDRDNYSGSKYIVWATRTEQGVETSTRLHREDGPAYETDSYDKHRSFYIQGKKIDTVDVFCHMLKVKKNRREK